MNLVKIIEEDYKRFPENQTYSIYAEDVRFKDPVYDFQGLKKYQEMIAFFEKMVSKFTFRTS